MYLKVRLNKKFLYSFHLNVKPIPWARPAPGSHGRMYDTQFKIKQEYLVRFRNAYNSLYLTQEPLVVHAEYNFAPPRSYSNRDKANALAGGIPYTTCDIDNITKFVFDLFNGVIWKDDRQILGVCAVKKYAVKDSISLKVWQWIPSSLNDEELQLDLDCKDS